MFEGGTSRVHKIIKNKIKKERDDFIKLVELVTEFSILYLKEQIRNGVDIVKVFDSWAGILDEEDYKDFIIAPNKKINKEIKKSYPEIPLIFFPRQSREKVLPFIEAVNPKILSLDIEMPEKLLEIAKEKKIILQGNLDPLLLEKGGDDLEKEIKKIMLLFSNNDHIFNLSHGILPTTPIDNVKKTIEIVRNFNEAK